MVPSSSCFVDLQLLFGANVSIVIHLFSMFSAHRTEIKRQLSQTTSSYLSCSWKHSHFCPQTKLKYLVVVEVKVCKYYQQNAHEVKVLIVQQKVLRQNANVYVVCDCCRLCRFEPLHILLFNQQQRILFFIKLFICLE